MSKFNSLVTKLREVFQIDRPDLDFGIYRIMNARADQITRYLEHDLRDKVTASLGDGQSAQLTETQEKLAEAEKNATSLGMDPAMVPAVKDLRTKLADLQNNDPGHEDAVFSHLTTFFSRYYEKGDYISQRRYKGDTYAIPYSGEEVVLHWANKDQYYIKSGESFTNYSFKLNDGRRVSFQLLAADTAKDNRKDNEENRLFALIPEEYSLTKTDEDGEEFTTTYQPIQESEDGDLLIHFTYQGYPKSVKKKDKNADSLKRILNSPLVIEKWNDLHSRKPTEKQKDRTLLEYHLTTYTEKNTADYFIHKDLGTFLRNELDFYIKNEVMHLDDVQNADTFDAIKDTLRLIQTLREIALDLIRFLAQLEDFQKKLWLKKKFVTQTDYCLTLDRIPEKLYPEIAANQAQHEEWLQLFAIAEIEAVEGDLAQENTLAYSNPLTPDFLKQNQHLVLDTVHFPEDFKAQLLEAIPNLDESLDGLVIHSENFQALNLLKVKEAEAVSSIYLDPPYNTGDDGFSYKDSFFHSSWMTMMRQSLEANIPFQSDSCLVFSSIDRDEHRNLLPLFFETYGEKGFVDEIVWQKAYGGGSKTLLINNLHENIICFSQQKETLPKLWLPPNPDTLKYYKFSDSKVQKRGKHRTQPLNSNSNDYRENLTYPIPIPADLKPDSKNWESRMAKIRTALQDGKITLEGDGANTFRLAIHNDLEVAVEELTPPRQWQWSWAKTRQAVIDDELVFRMKDGWVVDYKQYRFLPDGSERGTKPSSVLTGPYTQSGTAEIRALFNRDQIKFPKPLGLVSSLIGINYTNREAVVLDYFAGSGPTGHAVINLNREDGGKRKYILVEMGDHFDTVLRPRLKKVAYSANWKAGKPTSRNTGISHGFKYLRLESYEDVLNNLRRPESESDLLSSAMGQDYQLGYMLDVEARASLLSVADFQKPFDYQLNIANDSSGASEPRPIDLVETFNYLIGLTVEHYDRNLARGYAKVIGTLPTGEKTLILWRDCEIIGYEELDELCKKWDISPRQKEYDLVYINGDHNLPNVLQELAKDGGSTQELRLRQIEPEFLKLMFEEN